VLPQFLRITGKAPAYAGRPAQASPAVGSLKRHGKEQAKLVALALGAAAEDDAAAAKGRGAKAR
jgi:2-oxoglutarate dehydrogenase complex dehydrogenase (E1) component-like enzyme